MNKPKDDTIEGLEHVPEVSQRESKIRSWGTDRDTEHEAPVS